MDKNTTEVEVNVEHGLRQGALLINGKRYPFPRQAITTTNLNHLSAEEHKRMDYKTGFLEILISTDPLDLADDAEFEKCLRIIKGIQRKNPDKICFLNPRSAKKKRFPVGANELLIKLQIDAGLPFIRTFFKTNRQAMENLDHYDSLIPEGRHHMPVLDENLKQKTFKNLYLAASERHLAVGFFGREISKTKTDNMRNFSFIKSRMADQVLRMVLGISKKMPNDGVKSLMYYWLGIDVFAFATRGNGYFVDKDHLEFLETWKFSKLNAAHNPTCVINPKKTLMDTVSSYPEVKSSIPCSVYSMVRLNTLFETKLKSLIEGELAELVTEALKALGTADQAET